jgi:hypothetical protein
MLPITIRAVTPSANYADTIIGNTHLKLTQFGASTAALSKMHATTSSYGL